MYRGKAKAFLGDIQPGDKVQINQNKKIFQGFLMPRSELGDDKHLVIKLNNGYNMGFEIKDIKIKLISKKDSPRLTKDELHIDKNKKFVSIIGTGGTIASKIDYNTGAVHPAFSVTELTSALPEIKEFVNIKPKLLFNVLSENMTPQHWKDLAVECAKQLNTGAAGVVIAHGTDTLSYTAAALSFMLKNLYKPVVLVGSQRSSDRPSSDAAMNLSAAVKVATSSLGEVVVVMHGSLEDKSCLIHRGINVRKMHSSRRDAFRSINSPPIGEVDNRITFHGSYRMREDNKKVIVDDRFEPNVGLVKIHPGFKKNLLKYFIDNYRGLVIEGTGLGHIPSYLFDEIKRGCSKIPIIITSQTIYGRVDLKVYSTGRNLLALGIIPGKWMSSEVALIKLMYALGHTNDLDEILKIMLKNITGEIPDSSCINSFLM